MQQLQPKYRAVRFVKKAVLYNLEKAPLHPWECWAKSPLGKITFGPCRPFLRKLYLVIMDTHSKWIDALIVKSTSAEATISKLLTLFITHGLLSRL